jgi:hypothetical protein
MRFFALSRRPGVTLKIRFRRSFIRPLSEQVEPQVFKREAQPLNLFLDLR